MEEKIACKSYDRAWGHPGGSGGMADFHLQDLCLYSSQLRGSFYEDLQQDV